MRRLLLAGLLLFGLAPPLFALELREVRWGFAGGVTPGRFNLCSVRVINPAEQAFDGALALQVDDTIAPGLRWVAPCYVAPGGERWVQFHPRIPLGWDHWVVVWREGERRVRAPLPKPRLLGPQRVLLVDEDALASLTSRLPAFPAELFPPLVTATDTLQAIALDRSPPRWEASRREAFFAWLHRGGTVFLLGRARFGGPLAALDSPLERWHVGAGLVVRLPLSREQTGDAELAQAGFPATPPPRPDDTTAPGELGDGLFPALRRMTRPDHNWALIWWMAPLYLALIGPIGWLAGRSRGRYLRGLACFAGTVALFCLVFHAIGRRGYGEETASHTVSLAVATGDGQYDVTQWGDCFVTSGGRYVVRHAGSEQLYAVPDGGGTATSGKQGRLELQIPLFASRGYLYRGRLPGPRLAPRVARVERGKRGRVLRFELQVGPEFPPSHTIRATCGERLFTLRRAGDRLVTVNHVPLATLVEGNRLQSLNYGWREGGAGSTFQTACELLIVRRLGLWRLLGRAGKGTRRVAPRPVGQIDLFVDADSPPQLFPAGQTFARRAGRVLYHHVLFLEEK